MEKIKPILKWLADKSCNTGVAFKSRTDKHLFGGIKMDHFERFSDAKTAKEVEEFLEKLQKLQDQINHPTREGMIEALSGAQNVASREISILEKSQGEVFFTPWNCIPDRELYRKLSQYQQGLFNYAVNKFGEETFKEITKELINGQNH